MGHNSNCNVPEPLKGNHITQPEPMHKIVSPYKLAIMKAKKYTLWLSCLCLEKKTLKNIKFTA